MESDRSVRVRREMEWRTDDDRNFYELQKKIDACTVELASHGIPEEDPPRVLGGALHSAGGTRAGCQHAHKKELLVERGRALVDLCLTVTRRSSSLSERSAISGVPDPQRVAQIALKVRG